jgi:hypothetical protein
VVDQAKRGEWGLIKLWNSETVLDLTGDVSSSGAKHAQILTYKLKITNNTPVAQSYELSDPIPEHTAFLWGWYYDHKMNSVQWKGMIAPYGTQYIIFQVKVDKGTPKDTLITNLASLKDGALGDSVTITYTVK